MSGKDINFDAFLRGQCGCRIDEAFDPDECDQNSECVGFYGAADRIAELKAIKDGMADACQILRDALEREKAINADLLAALELATNELNLIRARDGAPQHIDWDRGQPLQMDSCTHEWWNELTEKCFAAIAKAKP